MTKRRARGQEGLRWLIDQPWPGLARRERGCGYRWWRCNTPHDGPPGDQMYASAEGRRYCFHPYRMKIRWRKMDRRRDRSGRAVDRTIGSTRARRNWFQLLHRVIEDEEVVRIRHTAHDEPAVLLQESRWRALERIVQGELSPYEEQLTPDEQLTAAVPADPSSVGQTDS